MKNNKIKVAINGFGRIGRQIFRINHEMGNPLNIVAVNNLNDNKTTAHLLKYDSNFGTMDAEIKTIGKNEISVDGKSIKYLQIKNPEELPWKEMGVDIVLESTGVFRDRDGASKHLTAGAKKVIITAPAKNPDATFVIGVNEKSYDKNKHSIVSNASCTTNCMAPLTKVLNDKIGIQKGSMTTIHSYTNDQRLLDLEHKDLRRARSATQSMIPTTTGAAIAVTEVIPELKGKLDGMAIRVPTPVVSLLDLTFIAKTKTSAEIVNKTLRAAARGKLKNILAVSDEPLVSIDYRKDNRSCIVDSLSTQVVGGNLVKVVAWYDNEWGYSTRTVELAKLISDKL
ncbi:type I glyceraldehyde-3-phosphate dehydrogenase [Candidatus Peregrinibacteria bacterium]|nr:type I glyceraldehyde-3-phosphate dehydrogenase [Candidatus Peregrinibacteria bacterium]